MVLKTIHYKSSGLDYVYVQVPVDKDEDGEEYIVLPMGEIEQAIAGAIVELRIPLRWLEVMFLRKALGFSLKSWADALGLSAAGVLKWERAKRQRLSLVNEAAVRAFCAEELEIEIPGALSQLVGKEKTPKRISVKLKDVA